MRKIARKMDDVRLLFSCCVQWKKSPEEMERIRRNREINKSIKRDAKNNRNQVKVLLLGAGESGKSTFLKQMHIIHDVKFNEQALQEFQSIVYQNIIRGMRVLVDARTKLGIPWENFSHAAYGQDLMALENSTDIDTALFMQYTQSVQKLWKDQAIQEAYNRRREFQLSDSVKYFFDNLDRISAWDYKPTNQDILHARKATKGVTECVIMIKKIPFRFVDVGGQRSQRQKWLQCFDSVTGILFLVSSSEYDQVLLEDRRTRRLEESRNIFETIFNLHYLKKVGFILFLNKTDLLEEKLKARDSNIAQYFPTFKGDPFSLSDVQNFILQLFLDARRGNQPALYHHFTTAVDTENIKLVFNAVKDIILQIHLGALMLQ